MELMADKHGEGLKLDPRTKMALLVTFSVFILGGMDGKLPFALSVILKALPPFLLLSVRQWKKAAAYAVLYTALVLVQEFSSLLSEGCLDMCCLCCVGFSSGFIQASWWGLMRSPRRQ